MLPPRPGFPPRGSTPRRSAWLALLLTALAVRLAFVFAVPPRIQWPNGLEYVEVAHSLVRHGSYGLQTLRPPGYPTFIALVFLVFGDSLVALRVVEAVVGTITVLLLGAVARTLFGSTAGWITVVLAGLHPVLAFLPATQFPENLLVCVLTLMLALAFDGCRRDRLWSWAGVGLAAGAAILIRSNVAPVFPGLLLGFAPVMRGRRHAWARAALASTVALALALSPWVARNHRVHGRWMLASVGGGTIFWLGNNPWATGDIHREIQPQEVADSSFRAALRGLPDEFARDEFLYRRGFDFIRDHPGRSARLYAIKLGNLFALYPETVTGTYVNRWSRWSQGAASLVMFLGGLLALGRWRRTPALWPLAGWVVSFTLVNALFQEHLRHRLVLEPALLLMAGQGWAWLLTSGRGPGAAGGCEPLGAGSPEAPGRRGPARETPRPAAFHRAPVPDARSAPGDR